MRQTPFIQPISLLLIVFFLYLVGFTSHALYLKKTVYGDGRFYYSWLRSVVIDHDINFTNEYAFFKTSQSSEATTLPVNKYAIGPAILWSVPFIFTELLMRGDGYSFPYQFVVGLTSVLYVITGLILLYRLLCAWSKPEIAAVTTTLIALATNLFFYGALDPVNSHGLSFFAATLFLTLLFQKQVFEIGMALALIALLRPQDAFYCLLILPFLSRKNWWHISIGFILLFSLQLLAWYAFTGNLFVSPYFTGGEQYALLRPHLFSVLFSLENGLFVYTPLVIIACIGFVLKWGSMERFKKPALAALLLTWYLVSSWSSWGQGASFSGRMFVGLFPLLAIPLSRLLTFLSNKALPVPLLFLVFVLPLGGINLLLTFYFLLTHG